MTNKTIKQAIEAIDGINKTFTYEIKSTSTLSNMKYYSKDDIDKRITQAKTELEKM